MSSSSFAAEVKKMEQRAGQHTHQHTAKGSPELALLAYSLVALLAYLLLNAV